MLPWRKKEPLPPPKPTLAGRVARLLGREPNSAQAAGWMQSELFERALQLWGLLRIARSSEDRSNPLIRAATVAESMVPVLALRKTAEDLGSLRPWWPLLLPLLGLVGYRTYREERAKVTAERLARAKG